MSTRRWTARGGMVIAALLALGLAGWLLTPDVDLDLPDTPPPPTIAKARPAAVERPALPLPARARGVAPSPGEASPVEMVACVLPDVLSQATEAVLVGTRDRRRSPQAFDGRVVGGVVRVPVPDEAGIGVDDRGVAVVERNVRFPGAGSARLRLVQDEGRWSCEVVDEVASVKLTGRVVPDGDAVMILGCGRQVTTDAYGAFEMEIEPAPCSLRAFRRDGAFRVRSEPVEVSPRVGDRPHVVLTISRFKAAGVGVSIKEHELGIEVQDVFPDSPGEAAGLRPGDVVIAVDGVDAVSLGAQEFVDVAVGPEGTEVTYTVLRGGREVDLSMVRRAMDRPEM